MPKISFFFGSFDLVTQVMAEQVQVQRWQGLVGSKKLK
jgi:hypothetical protein